MKLFVLKSKKYNKIDTMTFNLARLWIAKYLRLATL
jgi:hypothetical protein